MIIISSRKSFSKKSKSMKIVNVLDLVLLPRIVSLISRSVKYFLGQNLTISFGFLASKDRRGNHEKLVEFFCNEKDWIESYFSISQ